MSNITISNLHPAGSELFFDSESYLKDMSEEELGIQGGINGTWGNLPTLVTTNTPYFSPLCFFPFGI